MKSHINMREASRRYGYPVEWFMKKQWEVNSPPFTKMNGEFFYPVEESYRWFSDLNVQKHGIELDDCNLILQNEILINSEIKDDNGERTLTGIGKLYDICVLIKFIYKKGSVVKAVSIRKANKHERDIYQERLRQQY